MKEYAIYLRKSRADVEAEARGEGETLARHRTALVNLANDRGYHVAQIYAEVVSGDTIASRPQMQALLQAVQRGEYAGVICNDIDRLSRGDMTDQSIVFGSFASTGTLIITPAKIYDPTNDADSDFFDMSLFMARFEYRQIKKRMQLGKVRAAAEGHIQAGRVPYGYTKVRDSRGGWTLAEDPERAEIVRLIFAWYTEEPGTGYKIITQRLNEMHAPTYSGGPWTRVTVSEMLRNPIYAGRYVYQAHKQATIYGPDGKRKKMIPNPAPIIVEGAVPAIVEPSVWQAAQDIRARKAKPRNNTNTVLQNPLSGIVRCAVCGRALNRIVSHSAPILRCPNAKLCRNLGYSLQKVESAILAALDGWTVNYTTPPEKPRKKAIQTATVYERNKAKVQAQLDRAFELVETGIYTPQVYVQRRDALQAELAALDAQIKAVQDTPTDEEAIAQNMPEIERVLDAYQYAETAQDKSELLKAVVARVDYMRGEGESTPTLTVYPRIIPL